MNILDAIIATEFRYASATGAGIRKFPASVRVSDERIPERDAYNYLFVSSEASLEKARRIVAEELNEFGRTNAPHVKIVFHPLNRHWQRIEELESFRVARRFIMACPLSNPLTAAPDEHCLMAEKSSFEALYAFEFHMYEQKGTDYARLQTEIKLDTYASSDAFDIVVYTIGGLIVGNVELFRNNDIVKFDDFKVHEDFRRRGFGKKIQRAALSKACRDGAAYLYAITDDDGFVRELYEKDGFTEVGVLHTFKKRAVPDNSDRLDANAEAPHE
ncbi:hypothetical protein CHL67_03795 [Prosthecochloris sp. GSB1]|uniref:GNAT family N-acetyltransferase n=1 Tax=Prosthecochloris sp. GSB1 TaxID=281093 RepID=UPI000B8C78E6|nr:GNAT family N-acetyltransferase [Prosthecochloris sp. GSB1]ASQ90168.1 hypothetical protein CHL67_03795 [Prosthecochloris sp. GSB1]